MIRKVSSEELERLKKSGAEVVPVRRERPKPAEKAPDYSQQIERAAQSAERAENAAILVADIARSISEMSVKQLKQVKDVVANVNAGFEPVPWKVTVRRDNRGFIQDLDVIPNPYVDEAM